MKQLVLHTVFALMTITAMTQTQHRPVVSQYMHNALPLNPAFAGSVEALSVSASFRDQWTGMPGAPQTHLLSAHTPLRGERLAVGLVFWNDRFGVSRQQTVQAMLAYRVRTRHGKLSFALSGGVDMAQNNWSEVVTNEAQDVLFTSGDDRYLLPTTGAGVYYHTQTFYFSLSAPDMLTVTYDGGGEYKAGVDLQRMPLYFAAGRQFSLTQQVKVIPSVLAVRTPQQRLQVDANLLVRYMRCFELGASYRSSRALVGLMRYHISDQWSIAYAYDHWFSELSSFQNGTHELTLRYDMIYRKNAQNPKFF